MPQAVCAISFILLIVTCLSLAEDSNVECRNKEAFLAGLNMANECIMKAKELYLSCTDHLMNSSKTQCETREKSIGYLDVANNLINHSVHSYSTCVNDVDEKNPDTMGKSRTVRHEKPRDCSEILENGYNVSGVYAIWLKTSTSTRKRVEVFCDMDTEGGGWTVIQRRGNFPEQEDFFRDWATYKKGFGNLTKDFWLGNDNIHALTNQRLYSIYFDLQDAMGLKGLAVYHYFRIENETSKYKLNILYYYGNVGDAMHYHNNRYFSTKDRTNSGNDCASQNKGGWWYGSGRCGYSNPNGIFQPGGEANSSHVYWYNWKGNVDRLEAVEMKLKPIWR